MNNKTYGIWFEELLLKAGLPEATRRLFNTLAVPINGAGAFLVLGIVNKGVSLSAQKNTELASWSSQINAVYGALASMVGRFPILSSVTDRELNLDTFGPFANLASIGERRLFPSVLECIGWIAIQALRVNEEISPKTASQILTLQRSASRSKLDNDWDLLCKQQTITRSTLENLISASRNRDASNLASKILQSAFINLNPPQLNDISQKAIEPEVGRDENPQNQVNKSIKVKNIQKETSPPTVFNLKSKASYASPISTFALPDQYDRLAPKRLKKSILAIAADLELDNGGDRPALAATAILSLYINHSPRFTLNISLTPNNDIWIGNCGNLFFNHDAYIGISENHVIRNIAKISLPKKLKSFLKNLISRNPHAKTLHEALEISNQSHWLSKLENYLAKTGDSAHITTPGRLSHSLYLVYLEVGSTYEFAALDTLTPEIVGDSALNYVRVDFKYAQSIRNKVAQYLDLGNVEDETEDPDWIGSRFCPLTSDLINDWCEQSNVFSNALSDIEKASSISEVIQAFNAGSSANTRGYRVVTATRMQLTAHPSRRDLLCNKDYIYAYDKKTQPSSARILKRNVHIDQIINAQLRLNESAIKQYSKLGLKPNETPRKLISPNQQEAFFTELYLSKNGILKSKAIDIRTVTRNTNKTNELTPNSSRQWWGSVCATLSEKSWISRSLFGHGRKLATVGSYCTLTPPSKLIHETGGMMSEKFKEIELPNYYLSDDIKISLAKPNYSFSSMDKITPEKKILNSNISDHYCDHTTLPALTIAEVIRKSLCENKICSSSTKTLLSIVFMDGITDVKDIELIWHQIGENESFTKLTELKWNRESGQEIIIPSQPSTQIHFSLTEDISNIEQTSEECLKYLKETFSEVTWPKTSRGLLKALSWIMWRYQRVHAPPFLLYCYNPSVSAATYSVKSNSRLLYDDGHPRINSDDIGRITKPGNQNFGIKCTLAALQNSFWKIANGNLKKGGDKKRSIALLKLLNDDFTFSDADPEIEIVVHWLSIELTKWVQSETNPIEVDVMYGYLSRVARRISTYPFSNPDTRSWTTSEWKTFCTWILNVDDKLPEKQNGIKQNRIIALTRILTTLADHGIYKIPGDALPDDAINKSRSWCDSASRVYVSDTSIKQVTASLEHIFRDWEIKLFQIKVMHELFLSGCMRARENSALMTKLFGDGVAVMTECGFSHIKTELSQRLAILTANLSSSISHLIELLSRLPYPPEHIFSEENSTVNLHIGRKKADILLQLYRLILGDTGFVIHTLRGRGLQDQIIPNFEELVRAVFSNGSFPLNSSIGLIAAFNVTDPAYLAQCLLKSGHASHKTPAECYCSFWPYLYAAFMRSTQFGQRISRSLANSIKGKSDDLLRAERKRFELTDEWSWAITPNRKERRDLSKKTPLQNNVIIPAISSTDIPNQDDSSKYRYLVYRHFELDKTSAEHEAKFGRSSANAHDSSLHFVPSFKQLHKRTPGRIDKEGRPKMSAIRRVKDDSTENLIEFLRISNSKSASILSDLLSNKCTRLHINDVICALSAIPSEYGFQICWPKGMLDTSLSSKLANNGRISGLNERKHVKGGIRVRITPPGENPSEFQITHTTTLIRAALSVRKSLSASHSKEFENEKS